MNTFIGVAFRDHGGHGGSEPRNLVRKARGEAIRQSGRGLAGRRQPYFLLPNARVGPWPRQRQLSPSHA